MSLSFWIAKRYLFAKKSFQLVNFVSALCVIGITVTTGALLIVLSIFNGLENHVANSFNSFNPDLVITPKKGKVISPKDFDLKDLESMKNVEYFSEVLCDIAVLGYNDKQFVARIKGVRADYAQMTHLDTIVDKGNFLLKSGTVNYAVLGAGVASLLSCPVSTFDVDKLKVYYPDRTKRNISLSGLDALHVLTISAAGIFTTYTQNDFDFVFVPIDFARRLFNYEDGYTSVELRCKKGTTAKVQEILEQHYGQDFFIRNAYQQEEDLYKVVQSEKWIIYAILTFILVISSFNIMGLITVLFLEKKQQMMLLLTMGASTNFIRQIFFKQGFLVVSLGLVLGLIIGFLFCIAQYYFGFIVFGDGYLLSAYPVEIHFSDVLLISAIVLFITLVSVAVPVRKIDLKFQWRRE